MGGRARPVQLGMSSTGSLSLTGQERHWLGVNFMRCIVDELLFQHAAHAVQMAGVRASWPLRLRLRGIEQDQRKESKAAAGLNIRRPVLLRHAYLI